MCACSSSGCAALVCAVATSFPLLVAMRVAAGLVAGGVFPVAMALVGDLVPVKQRQVAIGRLLAIGLTGNLIGASIAGVIADFFGWRGVFGVLGAFGLIVAITAFFAFRSVVTAKPAASLQPRSGDRRTFGASSPIRAPRCASPRCSSKRSSSTGCFPTSRSCCWLPARAARVDRRPRDRLVRNRRRGLFACWCRSWSPGFPSGA